MVSIKLPSLILLAAALAGGQTPRAAANLALFSAEERGDLFMVRKMFREAITAYKNAPQNSPVTWNKIGIAWHNLGEFLWRARITSTP